MHAKGAFSRIQLHSIPSQVIECLFEIIYESMTFFSFYDDIVDIDLHIVTYLVMQAFLHASLVSRTCIFQPKGHGDIAISPVRGDKRCLYLIIRVQWDLVKTRITVKE